MKYVMIASCLLTSCHPASWSGSREISNRASVSPGKLELAYLLPTLGANRTFLKPNTSATATTAGKLTLDFAKFRYVNAVN